jgi:hypothetical protein
MRIVAVLATASIAPLSACGGDGHYAGLSRKQAVRAAETAIESRLNPTKRSYYETSIWNIAAQHATDTSGQPAWFVGIWNGQAETGACALAARRRSVVATVVPCADYPKFGQ